MSITIRTNNQARPLLYWHELTSSEQAEYDYLAADNPDNFYTFFRYKGYCYTTADFMRVDKHSPFHALGWQGYCSDSYFSGVLLKYTEDGDGVIVASYYS